MQISLWKKGLVLGIIMLFVGAGVIPSMGLTVVERHVSQVIKTHIKGLNSRGNILYVGGTGEGNYTSIQAAINDANDSDTVYVYNDSSPYYEYLKIEYKSINLIGEDKDSTIIDIQNHPDNRDGIYVKADWVNISGFTVRNIIDDYNAGIRCELSNNCNISGNNVIDYRGYGIVIKTFSNNSIISSNTVTCSLSGWGKYSIIITYYSCNNIVSGNTVSGNYFYRNGDGIKLLNFANNNIILDNTIFNNKQGIHLATSSNNNILCGNNISSNNYGVFSDNSCSNTISDNTISSNNDDGLYINASNNYIYHNNFISNLQNAYDEGNNIWNDSYPSGGNYWSDFDEPSEGAWDNDSDGIVDLPYPIPGGTNEDNYPLIYPWGENPPIADFDYYYNTAQIIFDGSFSYDRDGEIILYEWDFGDGTSGTGETVIHKYCEIGTYDVTLTVTDDDGLKDNITKSAEIILANIPPSKPEIHGPNTGKHGEELEYVFIVTDPDGDDAYLWVDWSDGDSTGWLGPLGSDNPVKLNHTWNESGTYTIMAKVKDFCAESEWAELEVEIPRNRMSVSSLFLQLFERFLDRFPLLERLLGLIRTV